MSSLLWNLALALAWVAVTGDLSGGNLVFGFGLGFLVLFFTAPILGRPTYVRKVIQVLNLALFFVWELVLANLRVAYEVLTPGYQLRPGVIATDMTSAVKDTYDRRIADGLVPEARWGQPEDVGRTVCALLRGDLPYATGSVIHVDGGLSLPRL